MNDGVIVNKGQRLLSIAAITPDPRQPRRDFPKNSLRKLADSLATIGQIEDIVVERTSADGEEEAFRIVAGERRWRAARMGNLESLYAKVVEIKPGYETYVQLAENIHRENLSDVRLGFIFRDFVRSGMSDGAIAAELSLSQAEILDRLGIIDRNALIDYQRDEIERLSRKVEDLEAERDVLKASLRA
jgi:ParB family chromosome partitioning protein